MEFMLEFYSRGKLSKNITNKASIKCIKDFRSIGLIDSLYKILVKFLAVRLQKVLLFLRMIASKSFLGIISMAQGCIVHSRQIMDGVLLANECIHSKLERGV